MSLWQHLSEAIQQHTEQQYQITSHTSVSGGCINSAFRVSNGKLSYFVKTNELRFGDMFEVEALSLAEMSASQAIRVPAPVCSGSTPDQAYLVLEYLELCGQIDPLKLGQQLAAMHRVTAPQYGWYRDNTIGSTFQSNQLSDNWADFWREHRLLPQYLLAQKNGYAAELQAVKKLLDKLDALFTGYHPVPSMLHGDLWSGNAAALADTTPVIFDPAFYYGDRETDIAMTSLFGGFGADFYAAYNETWPLDDGFAVRKTFYNLYHILNHLNLFGSGYLGQSIAMAEKVLAEI